MPVSQVGIRTTFFNYLFGEQVGWLCIATATPNAIDSSFAHKFFEWPHEHKKCGEYIQQQVSTHNVWFCVSLLKEKAATKDNCLPGSFIWADLDQVSPTDLQMKSLPATSILETSPGSYQGFWRLSHEIPADIREDLAKKVTYYVEADKGGWARNKLMRVPFTRNHKYDSKPEVDLQFAYETLVPVEVFDGLPDPPVSPDAIPLPDMPGIEELPAPANVIYKYSYQLHDTAFANLFGTEPHESDDWSKRMWRLINLLLESGLSHEETFSLTISAQCNKYKRDNRPLSYLWREILKAEGLRTKAITILGAYQPLVMPELTANDDQPPFQNFVTDYKDWASEVTDAVTEYHELCAFILLSATASAGVKLHASFGKMVPNLWGLVLGDSTLTRKTTAMELAMSFLREVDSEAVVATDGSPEGLLTVLSMRSDQVSVYYKDEISGLFSAINSKSYLSDMPETLTKMYDVPEYYSRPLRKETIIIKNPYFIFFGGGIKEKVYQLIDDNYVLSGFLPRFLIVNGYADLSAIRPTGPPNEKTAQGRMKLQQRINQLYASTSIEIPMKIGTQVVTMPGSLDAHLKQDAWDTFAEIERKMISVASESPNSMLALPTFTRMGFSLLKMAVLLAACRGPDSANRLEVKASDINEAAWFVQRWGRHSIDLINNAGISKSERVIEKVMRTVGNNPGCTKTYLMNVHRLNSKETTELLQTAADRGLIEVKKEGRGIKLWLVV